MGNVGEGVCALGMMPWGHKLGSDKDRFGGGRGLGIDGGCGAIGGRWGSLQRRILGLVTRALSPQDLCFPRTNVDTWPLWAGIGDENGESSE
jgi:hypothetical protein